MSSAVASHDNHSAGDDHAFEKISRFGMSVFLCSEAMLFAGLIGTYMVLRIIQGDVWIPEGKPVLPVLLTSFNTLLLVLSSVTFHFSEEALKKGTKGAVSLLVATIILGAAFVGIQYYEWSHMLHEGAWFDSGLHYTSCFFVLTGFHGFHVFVGVLLLTVCLFRLLMGHFTAEKHSFFGNVGLYWHFVDVVWILLWIIVYFNWPWELLTTLTHLIMK
jgi:cytochrome c oxidase subunit III